ncbi:MAG TPA: radical SAM family heme chaperone HemW [Bacteroidales bacterium]|nr:radical SAM family heme chaperone HemW [Bacteroidales bacterium]
MAGIYIHIPFCKKLCYYCDFYHVIARGFDYSEYARTIAAEAELRSDYLDTESVKTIYFGGGTPSVFSLKELEIIMTSIKKTFKTDEICEITIELNPDDVDTFFLKGLHALGFNRISLGVQSWRDEDLKLMNRRHDSMKAEAALKDCLNTGFSNVSVDLIYGLPGMSNDAWKSNLEKTFSFEIKHLSAYHLTFEKGTVFGKMLEKGLISEADEDLSIAMFNQLEELAERAGFIHYEISNFGKEGYFSLHNTNYWKQVKYLGLGPSAHSFNGYSRQWNKSDLNSYLRSIKSSVLDFEIEELDGRTRLNEYIMVSLRTMWGIDLGYVETIFGKEGFDYIVNMSSKFREYGLMKQQADNIVLTSQGKMISDNIISEFMMPE